MMSSFGTLLARFIVMKHVMISLIMALAAEMTWAQPSMTMDDCMRYAVEHSTKVLTRRVEASRAKNDYMAARASFLPTVEAQVSGQYSWGRNIDPETNTYNNVTTFNNYYMLYASLPVFDGFATVNAFKQARLARSISETAIQQAQDEQAIQVMQLFIETVYAQRSIDLASAKLADSHQLLHKTQRMFDLGEKSRPDVAQIASQVATDQYNLLHQQNTARQALLALKSAMNYPASDSLSLSMEPNMVPIPSASADTLYQGFAFFSPELRLAENAVGDARYSFRIQRAALLPRLTLSAEVATNFYRNITQGGSPSFSSQWSNNMGEYLVLSLRIPIWDASNWRSVKRAKSNIAKAQIELEEKRRKLRDDIQRAVMDRDGYAAELRQMKQKVISDSIAAHLSTRKYEEGILSTFDLQTATQTLLESRIKLLQTQLLLCMKQKLVDYYKGRKLY